MQRPLALITGASTGIGFELARCCAQGGYDLAVVADEPRIAAAAEDLRSLGTSVREFQLDLSRRESIDRLYRGLDGQPVDALLANAGRGLGGGFLDQPLAEVVHTINTNITGTVDLVQRIGRDMRARRTGRILITGSIAGFVPGTYQAIYNASKAFIDSFSYALRAEMKDMGVTVTCLMPGATETEFFARAGLLDTEIGQSSKDDPADVARQGFAAMQRGEGDVVTGWHNKLRSALANVTPASLLAELHRKQAAPGSGTARQ